MRSPAQLLLADGYLVDDIAALVPGASLRTPVRVASARFRSLWLGGVAAITLPWGIYLHPAVLTWPAEQRSRLLVHELVHAEQWRRLGTVRFLARYLGEYLAARVSGRPHGAAYSGISLEVEAIARSSRLPGPR